MKETRGWRRNWKLRHLSPVERYYFELKENNTYPFEDLGDGFYYIQLTSDKFLFGIGTIIVAIICYTGFSLIIGLFSFPLVLFIFTLSYGIFCMYGNMAVKELVISRHAGYLLRIKGNGKILVEEPIYNVYIKLTKKYDTNFLPHYYLILGGYRLDDIRLTGISESDTALRILGTGVATRIGINFFDVENNSTMHRVLHYPGKSLIYPQDDEFTRFLRIHGITQEQIDMAKAAESLAEDSILAPGRIVETIRSHYGLQTERKAISSRAYAATTPLPNPRETLSALLKVNQRHVELQELPPTSSQESQGKGMSNEDHHKHQH